ncbi:cupin family protein [Kribbella flavida DSM 17836]|uniref:Cupin family protein n=1 Tax=Kribbella flavida (strain DSM 17836 / JCM 10339 / NBRC 14399) TaxID=479435 RepID=D2PSR6_KRIFD|nr:cupin domain-containing protein [Kribbella flavida]ADB33204.1 cupin family protein [Kribbella flavida DSM 17836]
MNPLVTLDKLDWAEFAELYWDRHPVLIRGVRPVPFRADEVFSAALRARCAEGGGRIAPNASVTVEQTVQADRDGLLPAESDGCFDGYERRVGDRLDGRKYALIISAFHAFDFPLWDRERRFFAGLWDEVGLPLTSAITTLFHGNYDHSPVGVHKDRFATFMFGLRERKRMRLWTERPWTEQVGSVVDYERFLPSSFAVEVEPGDLLYWPASYFHVGENCGRTPATSVNIGVPRTEHRVSYELEDLLADSDPARLLDDGGRLAVLADGIDAPMRQEAGEVLPSTVPPALAQALTAHAKSLTDRVEMVSLRRWTAGGLEPVPPPEPFRPLADGQIVELAQGADLAQYRGALAANGHLITADLPPEALQLLSSGRSVRVDAANRPALEQLLACRALRSAGGGAAGVEGAAY